MKEIQEILAAVQDDGITDERLVEIRMAHTLLGKLLDPVERSDKIIIHGNHGLEWLTNFAALHNKPMSIPEWGTGGDGSGDDPYFVEKMHQWLMDNHVIYASFWNSNGNKGKLSTNQYPNAAAKYRELFGSTSDANPATAPLP